MLLLLCQRLEDDTQELYLAFHTPHVAQAGSSLEISLFIIIL